MIKTVTHAWLENGIYIDGYGTAIGELPLRDKAHIPLKMYYDSEMPSFINLKYEVNNKQYHSFVPIKHFRSGAFVIAEKVK